MIFVQELIRDYIKRLSLKLTIYGKVKMLFYVITK